MKTIGLIGGMSWESTVPYYQIINEGVKARLGGFHSAKIALYSVDFAEIEACLTSGAWDHAADILTKAALGLQAMGADFILICTNTLHKVAPVIQARIGVPILHIAEATADVLQAAGLRKVALLGTKYTMTQDFYKDRLTARGFTVLIPNAAEIELVNDIIFQELCLGVIKDESRAVYQKIIERLRGEGAEGVILGCTEIGLLLSQQDATLPLFDTTVIHAEKAVAAAL